MLVDAVGVTETDLHDTVPLERKQGVGFDRLLNLIGLGDISEDVVSSVASRLARLDKRMTVTDRKEVEQIAGTTLSELAGGMAQALNPDHHFEAAQVATGVDEPNENQIAVARKQMITEALQPLVGNQQLREKLIEVRRSYEQIIDTATQDRVLCGEFSRDATDRARATAESFRQFIKDNRDEINALDVLYRQPYRSRLTYDDIRELANAIKRPPRAWTTDVLWRAYEVLDSTKVRGSGPRVNTDLVSLVRYSLGSAGELVAYRTLVEERFRTWLAQQSSAGQTFSTEQLAYLHLIKDHLAGSLKVERRDLLDTPFSAHGGLGRAFQLFGTDLDELLNEITRELAA